MSSFDEPPAAAARTAACFLGLSLALSGCGGSMGAMGPAGPGLAWVTVAGSSQQAESNTGYLAANDDEPVVITLPADPVAGDTVSVSGIGAAGWRIAQNDGQSIATQNVLGNIGDRWLAIPAPASFSVAASSDGRRLIAGSLSGEIYTSADRGASWTGPAANAYGYYVASSADGSRLVAATTGGNIFTSTDYGAYWHARETARDWTGAAFSADGRYLAAVVYLGRIYTSSLYGYTWTPRESVREWAAVASSADGATLIAADGMYTPGYLYVSTDFGASWTPRESQRLWRSLAASADGRRLYAVDSGGQLLASTDSGLTWTARPAPLGGAIAASADGFKLVIVGGRDSCTSIDGGLTWKYVPGENSNIPYTVSLNGAAASADGSFLVAVGSSGGYATTPTAVASTTPGAAGSLGGSRFDSVDLQYAGGGTFLVRSYAGYLAVR